MSLLKLTEAQAFVQSHFKEPVDVAVVLGSGLSLQTNALSHAVELSYASIPNFPKPRLQKVEGHAGKLLLAQLETGLKIAIFQGRVHAYEGHSPEAVIFPTRLAKLLGASTLILTNAAGGLDDAVPAGSLMLIQDHLNLTGANPLCGENIEAFGPRFPDMTAAYSPKLQELTLAVAKAQGLTLAQGIYAGLSGPSYETPAEIRMLKTLGAHAVGMSTVFEVIAARHCGLEVLALSMISNLAAGLGNGNPLSHSEVLAVGQEASQALSSLIYGVLLKLSA